MIIPPILFTYYSIKIIYLENTIYVDFYIDDSMIY